MKIKVSIIPQFRLLPFFGSRKVKYLLNDFSYGEFLIFHDGKPIYYLNSFDESYKELWEFISSMGDVEKVITGIGEANKMNLSITQKICGIDNWNGEQVIETDILEFPIALWEKYRDTVLNKK